MDVLASVHPFIHSFVQATVSGRNLSGRRRHQLPIQSLHPHRAYTLVGYTEKKVVNLYTLSVQRIITEEQGRGWRTAEERLWPASFLRKWPLIRHLNNVQKWDVHVGSGVNGPGRGNSKDDVTVGYSVLHTPQTYHVAGAEGARWKQMEKAWERPTGARSLAMVVDQWKRWKYQTTWSASWEICMQVRKQQLELDMEQQTGSK